MKTILAAATLLAVASPLAKAQSLRGVWKPVEIVINRGPNAGRHTTDIQPGLLIFTDAYFSGMRVRGFKPRPQLSRQPNDTERGQIFGLFSASAGTYRYRDSTLTMTPTVAQSPAVMAGGPEVNRVHLVGDTLWFRATSADGIETRTKWIRIERPPGQ